MQIEEVRLKGGPEQGRSVGGGARGRPVDGGSACTVCANLALSCSVCSLSIEMVAMFVLPTLSLPPPLRWRHGCTSWARSCPA